MTEQLGLVAEHVVIDECFVELMVEVSHRQTSEYPEDKQDGILLRNADELTDLVQRTP